MNIRENETYVGVDATQKTTHDLTFSCCKFVNSKFKESVFVNVEFIECTFDSCVFANAVFERTEIKFGMFINCTFIGMNWSNVSSSIASVFDKIDRCLLKFNNFVNLNLRRIDFGKSEIISSTFHQTTVAESNFNACNLENTTFSACDMQKSDFRMAQGFSIDINSCKLKGARFSENNLRGLVGNLGIKIE